MKANILIHRQVNNGCISIPCSSILEANTFSKERDCLIVYPGIYNIGDNSIILKSNITWKFIGSPEIISTSTAGTFSDDTYEAHVIFEGKPIIKNSNGIGCCFNLQNANSTVKGFWWNLTMDLHFYPAPYANPEKVELWVQRNDMDLTFTSMEHISTGQFKIIFNDVIPNRYDVDRKFDAKIRSQNKKLFSAGISGESNFLYFHIKNKETEEYVDPGMGEKITLDCSVFPQKPQALTVFAS